MGFLGYRFWGLARESHKACLAKWCVICFGHISNGLVFSVAILGVDKCFFAMNLEGKVLLRENGSNLGH